MKYVRLEKDIVAEIIPEFNPLFPGVPVSERYPREFVKKLVETDENVQTGMVLTNDGKFELPRVYISNIKSFSETTADKIKSLSEECGRKITNGIILNGSRYSMDITDQLNMETLYNDILNGAETVVYHADDEASQIYSSSDFTELYKTAQQHKKQEILYFNQLKQYVLTLDDAEKIRSVYYGQPLTGQFLETYNIMTSSL